MPVSIPQQMMLKKMVQSMTGPWHIFVSLDDIRSIDHQVKLCKVFPLRPKCIVMPAQAGIQDESERRIVLTGLCRASLL
jgi:hypothetical protein